MKAVVYERYGSTEGLDLREVAQPQPADDEALVQLYATSVNRSDWECLIGKPLYARIGGVFRPRRKVLGSDIAGRVVAVGKDHTRFQVGDEVFGDILGINGGFAEYVCVRGGTLARKPAALSFAQAAAIPQAAVIALQGIRDAGKVQPGQQVLINGAGGGGGVFAVQLAKRAGAEVTAVDSASKFDLLRSLGADHVIDYTRADFTKGDRKYDLVLDLVAERSVVGCIRALKRGGQYLIVGGTMLSLVQAALLGWPLGKLTGKRARVLAVRTNAKDIADLGQMCADGDLTPVIDRCYPLSETRQALQYLGDGHVRGKVVVTIADASTE